MRQGVSALKKFLCLLAGTAVVAVVAVPAAGQSTDKVSPLSVTRKTKPTKAAHRFPWRVVTYGKVKKPRTNCPNGNGVKNNPYCTAELPDSQACKGKVRVRFTRGAKVVKSKKVKLKSNCSYRSVVKLKDRSLAGKRLRVDARFLGNAAMTAKSSKRRRLLLGSHSKGL
jgi:hypothetical protein